MSALNKLERRWGKYAIPNLSLWLIGGYAIGFVLENMLPNVASYLTLDPLYIMQGQVWRLLSWVLIPEQTNLFWALIMMLFYYQLGTALERTWGTFRFNLYIWGGILFTILGAFLLYGIFYGIYGTTIPMGYMFSTTYINDAIFLAYALYYPEERIFLMFVIPIKMKWMAAIYALRELYFFVYFGWPTRVAIMASLLNFLIFFFATRNYKQISPKERRRKRNFKKQARPTVAPGSHKCAICGRTDLTNPELDFRFCSKCNGNLEYCQDHLFTHEHKK